MNINVIQKHMIHRAIPKVFGIKFLMFFWNLVTDFSIVISTYFALFFSEKNVLYAKISRTAYKKT